MQVGAAIQAGQGVFKRWGGIGRQDASDAFGGLAGVANQRCQAFAGPVQISLFIAQAGFCRLPFAGQAAPVIA